MRARAARSVAVLVAGVLLLAVGVVVLVFALPPLGTAIPREPVGRLTLLWPLVVAPLAAFAVGLTVYRLILGAGVRRLLGELACTSCGGVHTDLLHAFQTAPCPACGTAAEAGRVGPPTALLASRELCRQHFPLKQRRALLRPSPAPRWRRLSKRALLGGSIAALVIGGIGWVISGHDVAGGVMILGASALFVAVPLFITHHWYYLGWSILADQYDRSMREQLGGDPGLDMKDMMVLGYTARWVELGVLTPQLLAAQVAELERGEDRSAEHYRYGALMAFYGTRESFADAEVESLCAMLSEDPDPTMALAGLVAMSHLVRLTDAQFERVLASDLLREAGRSGVGPRRAIECHRLLARVDEDGWTPELVTRALAEGLGFVHRELLEWDDIDRATLESLAEKGANKAVRNMARQRLGRR